MSRLSVLRFAVPVVGLLVDIKQSTSVSPQALSFTLGPF